MNQREALKEYVEKIIDGGFDSIITMEGGAVIEMTDRAIKKVIENICDVNTSTGVREITIKLKAKPMDENRNIVAWGIEVPPPKLCGQEAITFASDIEIDAGGKGFYSKQRNRAQRQLPGFENVATLER